MSTTVIGNDSFSRDEPDMATTFSKFDIERVEVDIKQPQ